MRPAAKRLRVSLGFRVTARRLPERPRSAAVFDQPRDVAGWIGEQGDGEIAHIGDRRDHVGAQALGLVEIGLQIVDLGVDRNAGAAVLVTTDAAVDAAFAAGLDYAVLPLVVDVDLPVKKIPVEALQRGTV